MARYFYKGRTARGEAVENTVDRIGEERHVLSGRAKDMGSAAVLFCHLIIGLSWGAIAWSNLS